MNIFHARAEMMRTEDRKLVEGVPARRHRKSEEVIERVKWFKISFEEKRPEIVFRIRLPRIAFSG